MKRPAEDYELIRQCQAGTASAAEYAQLEQMLRAEVSFREEYVRYMNLDTALGTAAALPAPANTPAAVAASASRPRAWRSLWSAAAGIVIGVLCTSVVFAYVAPLAAVSVTLLQANFESGPAPLVTGISSESGRWSGDFTEVVAAEQHVQPADGKRMLRFLRADYEGKTAADGYVADLYQLIDLRPYQREFADGGAVVELSASFNAAAFPATERYAAGMSLHTLDAETVHAGNLSDREMLNAETLAMTTSSRLLLDRDPATWQRQTAELRLPPNAEYLLVRVGVTHATKTQQRVEFPGQYLDEVRLVLTRRAPLP
jgi:hypothetical protein